MACLVFTRHAARAYCDFLGSPLELIAKIEDEENRGEAFVQLVQHLPHELLSRAVLDRLHIHSNNIAICW